MSSDKKGESSSRKIPFFGSSKKKSVPTIPDATTNPTTTSDSKTKLKASTGQTIPPVKQESKDTKINPLDKVVLKANGKTFLADRVVGNGSFGVVVRAVIQETNQVVAIKKVLQDKRYKNRELQIMQMLHHCNVVTLVDSFFTNDNTDKPDEVYLNLVLEFVPDTVYRVCRHYTKLKQTMPMIYVKLYTYQLLRSLNYIHSIGVCHRDIKPQNLLLDPTTGVLKLCDFGRFVKNYTCITFSSAKALIKGEPNVSYICSRYYRAPELIFGSTIYTTTIDVWSAGCVMAELMIGTPLFPGESGIDQLVEIIKILGTPTKEEILAMNPTYNEYKFPQIKASPWSKVFRSKTPPEALDLISKLLSYVPTNRIKPIEAMQHPFFDEIRDPKTVLPTGRTLPDTLFNFYESELQNLDKDALSKLIPPHSTTLYTKYVLNYGKDSKTDISIGPSSAKTHEMTD